MNILKPIDTFTQIHPLNATHLLRTQPHRVYGDAGGNILEITVKRFAHTIFDALYSHGGIIVSRYHDVTTDGDISSDSVYLLRPSGDIR